MKKINASEINSFMFCERAWWYMINGEKIENNELLTSGWVFHQNHHNNLKLATRLKKLAIGLIITGVIIISIQSIYLLN